MRETPDVVRRFAEVLPCGRRRRDPRLLRGPAPRAARPRRSRVSCSSRRTSLLDEPRSASDRTSSRRGSRRSRQDALRRLPQRLAPRLRRRRVRLRRPPIPAFLDDVPGPARCVGVPDRRGGVGAGGRRSTRRFGSTPLPPDVAARQALEGAAAASSTAARSRAHMQHGLTGHVSGKQFLRRGGTYSWIRNHSAERDGKGDHAAGADASTRRSRGMYVGHYDAIGFARWRQKWRQRIERDTIAANMTGRSPGADADDRRRPRGGERCDPRALRAPSTACRGAQYVALSAARLRLPQGESSAPA